ncbi:nicotinate-nucleotide adenylyltransferase [Pokkaliibacter sp. CJK22405]|uniref:nicotinate-nucleotide adenylyltransferase n=1 Tax=Pokkaliibacter sp. CJK22405 TaxID=3384615 RepID=UPI00398485B0
MAISVPDSTPLVLLGGTFDPVHAGHLRLAMEIADALPDAAIRLLPCQLPVHKAAAGASVEQRLAMLEHAIADEPRLNIDTQELDRDTPSYTILTLEATRQRIGCERPLFWVIGMDSLVNLPSWQRWQEMTDFCHLLVIARPGWHWPESGEAADWLKHHGVSELSDGFSDSHGQILTLTMPTLQVSATYIRQLIGQGRSPRYLIPDSVWNFIQQQQLYAGAHQGVQEK